MKNFSSPNSQQDFASSSSLNKHKNIHNKTIQCEFFLKCFGSKSHLTTHMKTHMKEKLYACSTCDKMFALKHSLQRHQTTHSDVRKFKCNICPDERCFKTKDQLSRHMKYHYEPSHQCEVCLKKFHCISDLNTQ